MLGSRCGCGKDGDNDMDVYSRVMMSTNVDGLIELN